MELTLLIIAEPTLVDPAVHKDLCLHRVLQYNLSLSIFTYARFLYQTEASSLSAYLPSVLYIFCPSVLFMEVYSLEGAIQSFFETQISPTRQESDDLASSLLGGGPVVPFDIQGQFSYTVFSPEATTEIEPDAAESNYKCSNTKIVQFRLHKSKINIDLAQRAKGIHGNITARIDYYGEIGQHSTQPLAIYVIDMLPGVAYIEMGNFSIKMDADRAIRQLRITKDFAR